MDVRKALGHALAIAIAGGMAAGATEAREAVVLPMVGQTYAASYNAVWLATLKSLGTIQPVVADEARGRIETEQHTFFIGRGQVLWISLAITVNRTDDQHTVVQVQARVQDELLTGFLPGVTNNPWADLFARIQGTLGIPS
jgi:hypothetical protein